MNITDLISIRALQKSDVHFILDSSMQCLSKYTESIFKGMNRNNIYKHLEIVALYALTRIDTYSVFVACHKDDSNNILGYIVANPKDNHILLQYTKYSYRKLGIQKLLLMPLVVDESVTITVNWPTKEMLKLAKAERVEIVNRFTEKLIEDAA
ncbi:MAG: hypothetical protein JWL77_6790 [Chthonomonadaceae bacterium]|nr:hypothetical protein [Chthonomonadaceae bacterium]